jgi:glucose-1-phosphate thymidylyltransferase
MAEAILRKGIIAAGGLGFRLFPITRAFNKQLIPVYDKPMIYYPLSTLMLAGIREIVVVSHPGVLQTFESLLGDGRQWGLVIEYATQPAPTGIANVLLAAAPLVERRHLALILGDNIFYGTGLPQQLRRAAARPNGATIFGYPVKNPRLFGVVTLDREGRPTAIEEKPARPQSNLAVPGLYFYDAEALDLARRLVPSPRGELEITDLNRAYLQRGELHVEPLGRGSAWLDGGTPEALFDASQFVRVIEERTGLKIACLEEVAYRMGFISLAELDRLAQAGVPCSYNDYLKELVRSEKAH